LPTAPAAPPDTEPRKMSMLFFIGILPFILDFHDFIILLWFVAVNCWKLSFFLLSILFIRGRVIWIWLQELAKKAKHDSPPNISLGSVSDTVGRSDAADVGAEEQHDYLK
jgi:hypothetical protein